MARIGRGVRTRSTWADTSGIRISDTPSEQASAIEIVRPTSPSQTVSSVSAPTTSGRKTIRVVAVEAVTAINT